MLWASPFLTPPRLLNDHLHGVVGSSAACSAAIAFRTKEWAFWRVSAMSVSSTHRSPPAHGNKLAIKLQMLLRDSIPIIVIKENADCYVRRLQPVLRTSLTMPDVGRSASDALQIELPAPGPKLSAGIVETRILNNSKLRAQSAIFRFRPRAGATVCMMLNS